MDEYRNGTQQDIFNNTSGDIYNDTSGDIYNDTMPNFNDTNGCWTLDTSTKSINDTENEYDTIYDLYNDTLDYNDTLYDYYDTDGNWTGDAFTEMTIISEMNAVLGIVSPIIMVLIVISNTTVVVAFLRKGPRTPVVVVLSSLAVSDTLCGVFRYCTYSYEYYYVGKDTELQYPYCAIVYAFLCLSDSFHICSVCLTAILGIQKSIVVQFPLRIKKLCSMKYSLVLITMAVATGLAVWTPTCALEISNYQPMTSNDSTCVVVIKEGKQLIDTEQYSLLVEIIIVLTSSCVMAVTTLMLSIHLIRSLKIHSHGSFKQKVQTTRKRSTAMVIAVSIAFFVAEIPRLTFYSCILEYYFGSAQVTCDVVYDYFKTYDFHGLSFQIGSFCNLWIYMFISRSFRENLAECFKCATFKISLSFRLRRLDRDD